MPASHDAGLFAGTSVGTRAGHLANWGLQTEGIIPFQMKK